MKGEINPMKCPACERIKMIENLIKTPTSENREKLSQILKFEEGFVISGITNLSELKDCPLHNSFIKYQQFLLFLNSTEIKDLLFQKSKTIC